jgi:sec-independent protein translocase protein TatA
MFKTIGWPELIVFLVLILLIFGVGRISKVAGEIGEGIRAFKEGLSGEKNKSNDEHNLEEDQDDTEIPKP